MNPVSFFKFVKVRSIRGTIFTAEVWIGVWAVTVRLIGASFPTLASPLAIDTSCVRCGTLRGFLGTHNQEEWQWCTVYKGPQPRGNSLAKISFGATADVAPGDEGEGLGAAQRNALKVSPWRVKKPASPRIHEPEVATRSSARPKHVAW